MQKLICVWQGNLISVNRGSNVLDLYTLRREGAASGRWALNRELGSELCGDIQACGVAVDAKRGTKSIFLASFQRPSSKSSAAQATILYMYSPSTRKLLRYGESPVINSQQFMTTAAAQDLSTVCILDGPIVVWSEGKLLQVMYAVDHSHKLLRQMYDIENLISDGYHLTKASEIWPFLWAEERGPFQVEYSPILIVFLKLKVTTTDRALSDGEPSVVTEWVCLQVKPHPQGLSVKLLRDAELIPHDYGCISTCVALHKSYGADFSSGDISLRYHFLVGTEFCQVVRLHHGVVLQCVAIKYIPLQIALLDSQLEQLSFACRGNSGEASAYHLTDEGETQKCGEWHGVCEMVVGDFAHLGREQLLLLYTNSATEFLVTDLNQFSTVTKSEGEEGRRAGQQCAESLVSVVNALHLRKQNGEVYLTSIKRELQLKTELLKRSLSLLKSLERPQQQLQRELEEGEGGGDSSIPALRSDPRLVCIVPGEEGVSEPVPAKYPALSLAQPHSQPPLKLVKLWQRLKSGSWVIGAVVKNHSSEELKDVRFSVAPLNSKQGNSTTDCSSRVVWIERTDTPSLSSPTDSPPAKRRKIEEPLHGLLEGLMEDLKKEECHERLTIGAGMKLSMVLSTAVPSRMGSFAGNCEESVVIVATWKKAGEKSVMCSSPEEMSAMGVASLSFQHLCSGELNLHHQSSLSLWNGKAILPKETNFEERGYQDLACVLGMSSFLLVEASSRHSNLLHVAAMLRSHLPLQSRAIITNEEQTDTSCDRGGKVTDDAIQYDCHGNSHSLEVLEGVMLHVSPRVNSAKIAVLFRSLDQLSLLLSSMKHCLPVDVSLQVLTGTTDWTLSLKASLTSVLEEAKARCSWTEQKMRGRKDSCSEEEKDKLLDKLRDKTDLRMSMMQWWHNN